VKKRSSEIGHIASLLTAAVTGTFPFILGATVAGHLVGRMRDDGVTNKFLKSLEKELQPNTQTTRRYTHVTVRAKRPAVEAIRLTRQRFSHNPATNEERRPLPIAVNA